MFTATISFDISPTNADQPLGCEVWLNDLCVSDIDSVTTLLPIKIELDDETDSQHQLRIVIKNKTQDHTRVDEQGNIISDSLLEIKNFCISEIAVDQVIESKAVYTHDFNGSSKTTSEVFSNFCGCNGTVTLNFSTPIYHWLLDSM